MKSFLIASLAILVLVSVFLIPQVHALPVSYNTTSLSVPLFTTQRNTSSYDVFLTSSNSTVIPISSGLITFYKWELNQIDTSGKGQTAVITGTDNFVNGHSGYGFSFDGATKLTINNSTIANFERTNTFSVALWLKFTTAGTGTIFAKTNSTNHGYFAGINAGTFTFFILNNFPGNYAEVHTVSTFNDNKWHYVVFTYDGSSTAAGMKIYVDTVLSSSAVADILSSSITNNQKFTIGQYSDSSSAWFTGSQDEFSIFNTVLTPTQISTLYNLYLLSPTDTPNSWYHGVAGSGQLKKVLGYGKSTLNTACLLNSPVSFPAVGFINDIYYMCGGGVSPAAAYKINIYSGNNTLLWHTIPSAGITLATPFIAKTQVLSFTLKDGVFGNLTNINGNVSLGVPSNENMTNQKIFVNPTGMYKYNFNGTVMQTNIGSSCALQLSTTNATRSIDKIACDQMFPANMIKYYNGMLIQGNALTPTNSTQFFMNSIDANGYKHILTAPCLIMGMNYPCVTTILNDTANQKWFIGVDASHIYYNTANIVNGLVNQNRAWQSYDLINPTTDSTFGLLQSNSMSYNIYGFTTNATITQSGMLSIPSGYTIKTLTSQSAIRTIDPRWTNDIIDYPILTTSNTIFPIFLTVSNAPQFAAIKVTNPLQAIGGTEAVLAVAQLDATKTVEFDIPPGLCVNTYIADISVSPSIWNFQGIICATGTNQKTEAYTNTLPLSFFTLQYGVSDSYVPNTNSLTTSFHTNTSPVTYTVIVKNSTGVVAINQTFTVPANQTLDTRSFNVSSVTKPAGLFVSVGGNQIYTAYLGSALSLASTMQFFHQYMSYQGFDLLSFIPIIFASMFTRNTVGIGAALTVVLIATLSWLSIVVISETSIAMMIVIAVIGMIGYRAYGY